MIVQTKVHNATVVQKSIIVSAEGGLWLELCKAIKESDGW